LDDAQLTLLTYARFYESIAGMMPSDRPDDAVIEDDAALDKWYKEYSREQAIKYGKKTSASSAPVQVPQFKGSTGGQQ
jgi:hypothetical protein